MILGRGKRRDAAPDLGVGSITRFIAYSLRKGRKDEVTFTIESKKWRVSRLYRSYIVAEIDPSTDRLRFMVTAQSAAGVENAVRWYMGG